MAGVQLVLAAGDRGGIVVIVRIARRKGGGKKFSLKRKKAKTGDTEPKE